MKRAALLVALAAAPAWGHGASKGLHLHATPERPAPGSEVTIAVDAARPMREVKVGFVGGEPVRIVPRLPVKRIEVVLRVPAGSTSAHAEAITDDGRTVRAAVLLGPQRDEKRAAE